MNAWISAARPRTLPLALSGLLAGNAMALSACIQAGRIARWDIALLSILTAVALQVLSNFANDLGDTENGADNLGRIGPQRAVQAGLLTREQMRRGVIFMSVIALGLGLFLLYHAFGTFNSGFFSFEILGILSSLHFSFRVSIVSLFNSVSVFARISSTFFIISPEDMLFVVVHTSVMSDITLWVSKLSSVSI